MSSHTLFPTYHPPGISPYPGTRNQPFWLYSLEWKRNCTGVLISP